MKSDFYNGLKLDIFFSTCLCVRMLRICLPESPEYEAKDISVRVMSPQSVLISWVDPAVEMGKVAPGVSRWESMGIC